MKLTGPGFSLTASGSLGKTLVYAAWKGVAYARQLVIPNNPQSADQGDNRLIVGGIGRGAAKVEVNSGYHAQMIALGKIVGAQSKQSALVKFIKDSFCVDATAYEAIVTAFEAHTAEADFETSALEVGLATLDIAYKGTSSPMTGGCMLYLLAKAADAYGFTGAPYSTALASWTATEIDLMVADLVTIP